MDVVLQPSALQAYLVLALAGATSAYIAVARPTLSRRKGEARTSSPATLLEAGASPALSSSTLAAFRGVLAVYIFSMGATQMSRLGLFVFKFYTIWNWWLLGLYFALAAIASALCARHEASSPPPASAAAAQSVPAGSEDAAVERRPSPPPAAAAAVAAASSPPAAALARATMLSRACHALFLINSSTVIIVDVVCWAVLYPMLARGPQTPEVQRIVRRLLLTFTSYNQHGLNALYIFVDLFLNRHRLAFHAVGPLGLWSLLYSLWAHAWHAKTGKWLYPFLDTSKPWAPAAYFGLYMVHWLAFGLVALLYRIKYAVHGKERVANPVKPPGEKEEAP